jgi:hypothetical protein
MRDHGNNYIHNDRTKTTPTPKQDKWKDPLFRSAIATRTGRHKMVMMWRKVKLARRGK